MQGVVQLFELFGVRAQIRVVTAQRFEFTADLLDLPVQGMTGGFMGMGLVQELSGQFLKFARQLIDPAIEPVDLVHGRVQPCRQACGLFVQTGDGVIALLQLALPFLERPHAVVVLFAQGLQLFVECVDRGLPGADVGGQGPGLLVQGLQLFVECVDRGLPGVDVGGQGPGLLAQTGDGVVALLQFAPLFLERLHAVVVLLAQGLQLFVERIDRGLPGVDVGAQSLGLLAQAGDGAVPILQLGQPL